MYRKVVCSAEEVKETVLAYDFVVFLSIRYDNFEGPYLAMDRECKYFKQKLSALLGNNVPLTKQINIYYEDPRFTNERNSSLYCLFGRLSVGYCI